ncbi:MAG: SRPBCC family protein [Bdellovibrionota bacterium]
MQKSINPTTDFAKNLRGHYHEDNPSRFAVTINQPQQLIYSFFRNFENLSLFMKDLKSVIMKTDRVSHWIIRLKNGMEVAWDAQVTAERPGEMIGWQSLEGSEVETSGSIWFSPAPAGRGTVVSLTMDFKIPGGPLTEVITMFTGEDPESLAHINLRRLKAFLETGEVPTTEGQPSGREKNAETITDKH